MPTSIKIPKVNPDHFVKFSIYRKYEETPKAFYVTLYEQIIEGVKIPKTSLFIPQSESYISLEFSSKPCIYIKGWRVNQLLKLAVMEGLRNGK